MTPPAPPCLIGHIAGDPPCTECGWVPGWFYSKLVEAGVPSYAPHIYAAYALFAYIDMVDLLEAFERTGPKARAALGTAFALGGQAAARQVVEELDIPGVRVDPYGHVVWDPKHPGGYPPKVPA